MQRRVAAGSLQLKPACSYEDPTQPERKKGWKEGRKERNSVLVLGEQVNMVVGVNGIFFLLNSFIFLKLSEELEVFRGRKGYEIAM